MSSEAVESRDADHELLPSRAFAVGSALLSLVWLAQLGRFSHVTPNLQIATHSMLRSRWLFSLLEATARRYSGGEVVLLSLALAAHGAVVFWLAVALFRAGRTRAQRSTLWLFAATAVAALVTPASVLLLDNCTTEAAALLMGAAGIAVIRKLTRSPRLPLTLFALVFVWGVACVLVRGDLLFATGVVSAAVSLEIFTGKSRRMAVEHPTLGTLAALTPLLGGLAGALAVFLSGMSGRAISGFARDSTSLAIGGFGLSVSKALFVVVAGLSCVALLVLDGMGATDIAINLLLLVPCLAWAGVSNRIGPYAPAWTLAMPLFWNLLRLCELDGWRHLALEPVLRVCLGLILLALFALSIAEVRPTYYGAFVLAPSVHHEIACPLRGR